MPATQVVKTIAVHLLLTAMWHEQNKLQESFGEITDKTITMNVISS